MLIREATEQDALQLAELSLMASHGLFEAFYRDLIPGRTTTEVFAERRIRPSGGLSSFERWKVADKNGSVLGAINSFPIDAVDVSRPDPLLTPERTAVAATLSEMEKQAAGTYYINAVAVFPAFRGAGVGRKLMNVAFELAREAEFSIVTLSTFEEDRTLLDYYRRLGFVVSDTRPLILHPCIPHGGNWVLMAANLAPGDDGSR